MKRGHIVITITAVNISLLAVGALLLSQAVERGKPLPQPREDTARINWLTDTSTPPVFDFGRVSPLKRESAKVEITGGEISRVYTDAELQAELNEFMQRELLLLRIIFSETAEMCRAAIKVKAAGKDAWVAPDYSLLHATRKDGMPAWASDVQVLSITAHQVTLNAPSQRERAKRFDVTLKLRGMLINATTGKLRIQEPDFGSKHFPDDFEPKEGDFQREEGRLKEKSLQPETFQLEDGAFVVGENDRNNKQAIDEAAASLRVIVDEKGNPIGLQVPEDVKDKNLLLKRGFARGDIIKSVNGHAVKSMSDVRRKVREEYEKGTREFEVGFERDGVPRRQMFKVPGKKN